MRHPFANLALSAFLLAALPAVAVAQSEEGHWTITPQYRGRSIGNQDIVQLTLLSAPDNSNSFSIDVARLRGLSLAALNGAPASARFQIVSDAGTVSFTGHVGEGTGSGRFDFAPDKNFADAMRRRGLSGSLSDHDLFRLTLHGTNAATLDVLFAALRRYDDAMPTASELVRFTTHGVDGRTITDLGEAGTRGLSPESIVRLVNHDVDGAFIKEWRAAGYSDLDAEELIRLRNHGVSASWAKEANDRAGRRLSVEPLLRLRRGR
jgi:hypothetical protein